MTTRGAWEAGKVGPCIDLWRDDGPAYGENGVSTIYMYVCSSPAQWAYFKIYILKVYFGRRNPDASYHRDFQ